jgi:uncharacterized membrane protein
MTPDGWFIYIAILGMGLATYATRLAGYVLLSGKQISGQLKTALEAVPPAILTAVIAPTVFLQGPAEMISGAITLVAAILKLPLLVTIGIGVGSVALLRTVL